MASFSTPSYKVLHSVVLETQFYHLFYSVHASTSRAFSPVPQVLLIVWPKYNLCYATSVSSEFGVEMCCDADASLIGAVDKFRIIILLRHQYQKCRFSSSPVSSPSMNNNHTSQLGIWVSKDFHKLPPPFSWLQSKRLCLFISDTGL